jgi:hypothetical protein
VWNLIVEHPKYPVHIGVSYNTGRSMLGFGRADDADAAREASNVASNLAKKRDAVTEPRSTAQYCNIEALVAAVKLLSPDFEQPA